MTHEDVTPGVLWVSVGEAGRFYGVGRRTIYNWLAAGKLVTRETPGGNQRIAINRADWELTADEARRLKVSA